MTETEDAEKAATEIEIFNSVTFVSQGYTFTLRDSIGCPVTIQDTLATDWTTPRAWGLDGQPTGHHFRLRVYDDVVTRERARPSGCAQPWPAAAAADVKPDNPQVYPDWVDTSEHRDAKHVIDHILGDKIGAPGRQALRKALDTVDAGPQGRAKHDQALGRALRVSPPGIVR